MTYRVGFWRKGLLAWILLVFLYRLRFVPPARDRVGDPFHPLDFLLPEDKSCAPIDTSFIHDVAKTAKFASEVTYWKRRIRTDQIISALPVDPNISPQPSYSTINEPLLPKSAGLQIQKASLRNSHLKAPCLPPLTLPILPISKSQPTGEVDFTPLILGISTTIDRLRSNSIEHFQRFLTRPVSSNRKTRASNNAGFVVLIHNCSDEELEEGNTLLKEAGINAVVKRADPDKSTAERYFSLIPMLLEQSDIDAQNGKRRSWIVLIEDDTFFPRPNSLMKTLKKMFPKADEEKIIAGCQRQFFLMENPRDPGEIELLGGAGIFISIPTARTLTTELHDIPENLLSIQPNKIPAHKLEAKKASYYDICLEEFKHIDKGDSLLSLCMKDRAGIERTNIPSLHPMDMSGDESGIYESGGPFLSIYNWKSEHNFSPARQTAVGDVCGEACVFQRFVFLDNQSENTPLSNEDRKTNDDSNQRNDEPWPIVLTNGFSISEYEPTTFQNMDLDMMESTMSNMEDFDYGVGDGGGMRETVGEGMKRQWMLLDARSSREDAGWRTQWYGLRNGEGEIEKIAELVWVRPG